MPDSSNKKENIEKKTDRHLQAPQEANRDKHINFVAIEQGDEDPANEAEDITHSRFEEKTVEKKNRAADKRNKEDNAFEEDDQAH
jgi:hypothetical protein